MILGKTDGDFSILFVGVIGVWKRYSQRI